MNISAFRRGVVVLGSATAIGFGIGYGPSLLRHDAAKSSVSFRTDSRRSVASLRLPNAGSALSQREVAERMQLDTGTSDVGARSPQLAVRRFLAAEQRGDEAEAWGALSDADRTQHPSPAAWRKYRRTALPSIVSFAMGGAVERLQDDAGVTRVSATLRLRSSLDEVLGLVPSDAAAEFVAEQRNDGWHVNFAASRINFRYLSVDGLYLAARTWAVGRSECAVVQQWRSSLYGDGAEARARSLCRRPTPTIVERAQSLSGRSDTAPLLAAFGPTVGVWARVVTVIGAETFDLVLAPVGQQWLVIGVLPTTSRQGQG